MYWTTLQYIVVIKSSGPIPDLPKKSVEYRNEPRGHQYKPPNPLE
jgi:hypothetical protein